MHTPAPTPPPISCADGKPAGMAVRRWGQRAALLGLAIWVAVGGATAASAQSGLGIAAVVNDEAVSMLDLETRISLVAVLSRIENSPETRRRLAPQVLRTLVDEKLQQQEARRLEIKVSVDEVAAAVRFIEQQNKMPPGEISRLMEAANIPMASFIQKTETEVTWQRLVRQVMGPKIKVSEEEVSDVIKQAEANAGKPEYLLAEIYLPIDQPQDQANVRQAAERLLEQIKGGAPFSRLASNFSGSPSAAVGGDLGWVARGQMDPELEKVIETMSPGQISEPVRALAGYYILLLREVRTGKGLGEKTTLKISQFHRQLDPKARESERARVMAQLRQQTGGLNTCAAFEAAAKKVGSPLSGSLGQVDTEALPDDMRNVLKALPVHQPSEPIATGGGLAVLMICERTVEEVDMEQTRANISNQLALQRLQIADRRYLLDLRRAAFLDIRL